MAQTAVIRGRYTGILLGDGADPEVFTKVGVGTLSKNISQSVNLSTEQVPDEADPTVVTPDLSFVTSRPPSTISLSSRISQANILAMQDWFKAGTEKNIQIVLYGTDGSTVIGHWAGACIISQLDIEMADESYVESSITLTATGGFDYLAGPPA